MSPRGLAAGLVLLAAVGAAAPAPPDHEQACRANNRGVALLEQFQPEQAVPQFRAALTADAGLSLARVNLALALLLSGDLAGAGKEAGAAAAAQPDSPRAWHVLGLARRAQDQGAEAQAAFRRVLELDPGDVAARVFLAQLLLADAQAGPAAELLRAAVEREPWNATAVYALGQARLRLGQREEGQSLLARFQELREAPAALTYGQAYGQQGRYSEAAVTTGAEPGSVDAATPPLQYVAHPIGSLPVPRLPAGATAAFALTLFDQDVDKTTAEAATSYTHGTTTIPLVPPPAVDDVNATMAAMRQFGDRIAFLWARDPVGPFVARTLGVSGVKDLQGHEMAPTAGLPVIPDPDRGAGAQVMGRVLRSDGVPVAGATHARRPRRVR